MKNFYNIKDQVWIHLGEPKLVEGRVVEIIDLEHLGEGHTINDELYIIEISTPIEPVYEVRSFNQISPDSTGPIVLYRELANEAFAANRLLKKVGVTLPDNAANFPPDTPSTPSKSKFKKRFYKKKR